MCLHERESYLSVLVSIQSWSLRIHGADVMFYKSSSLSMCLCLGMHIAPQSHLSVWDKKPSTSSPREYCVLAAPSASKPAAHWASSGHLLSGPTTSTRTFNVKHSCVLCMDSHVNSGHYSSTVPIMLGAKISISTIEKNCGGRGIVLEMLLFEHLMSALRSWWSRIHQELGLFAH